MEQTAGSFPALSQTAVRTGPTSRTRGVPSDAVSRFLGDGVRYKAKLIGIDTVPDSQGEKMCRNSMMKLKGLEEAARKQGKHKLRIWIKISSSGLKIVDERTGMVVYDHDRDRISSLTKDEFDPRALAYIYQQQDKYALFYIKMANQADPVLLDIKEVCQRVDPESSDEPTEIKNISLDGLHERIGPVTGNVNQIHVSRELMEVFSPQMEEPLSPVQTSGGSQPEFPQQKLSNAQILSIFPNQPAGGATYNSPPFSPTTTSWGQQGNQWTGRWPVIPGVSAWAPSSITAPPGGGHLQASGVVNPQLGFMMDGVTTVGHTNPLKSLSPTTQPGSPGSSTSNNHSLI